MLGGGGGEGAAVVSRQLAWDPCSQEQAGGRGGRLVVSLQLSRFGRGLAREVIFRVVQGMERDGAERRRWVGSTVGAGSQGRLQGRVQDVVLVAIAVGVAVVALGAGVVGRLLQPHQHVHQRVSFSITGGHLLVC